VGSRSSDAIQRPTSFALIFDHAANVIIETLIFRDGTWTWQAAHHRCKGVFTDKGKTLTAHHEHSEDGKHWLPSMVVTLRKVE
jgi:hypothetical protein